MNYILTFENGIEWTSPNIFEKDPGWSSEENGNLGGIKKIKIPLSKDKAIVLEGFEKYNFFVEALKSLKGGCTRLDSFFFCGAFKGRVLSYQFKLKTNRIIKRVTVEGKEYVGTATRGWRQGILGVTPKEGICSL